MYSDTVENETMSPTTITSSLIETLRTVCLGSAAAGAEKWREKNWNSTGLTWILSPGHIWTGTDRSHAGPVEPGTVRAPVH